MELTRAQVQRLADRFDDMAYDLAGVLEAGSEEGLRERCDRLNALCGVLAYADGTGCEDDVIFHFVAGLVAAMKIRLAAAAGDDFIRLRHHPGLVS